VSCSLKAPGGGPSGAFVVAILALLFGSSTPVLAQPAVTAQLGGSFDSVALSGEEALWRGALAGRVAPEIQFAGERARVFYVLDGASAGEPGSWRSMDQRLGGTYRLDLGGGGQARVFLGADATFRRNGELWRDVNFDAWGAGLNLELRPRAGATLRTGYRVDDRSFANAPELDHSQHEGFVSLNLNLRTRTTLISEARMGWKGYAPQVSPLALPPVSPTGNSRGRGATLRLFVPIASAATGETARQLTWLVRVAQSLTDRTGLALQYTRRDPSGSPPSALVAIPPQVLDDEVYDDPFASDRRAWRASVKHAFASGAAVELSGTTERREYVSAVATDAAGEPLPFTRSDRIERAEVELLLPLLPGRTGDVALSLEAGMGLLRRRSNDDAYDYRSSGFSLGLRLEY